MKHTGDKKTAVLLHEGVKLDFLALVKVQTQIVGNGSGNSGHDTATLTHHCKAGNA